jgi:3-phosphoshikimate 1-carboxyvinyltransferase
VARAWPSRLGSARASSIDSTLTVDPAPAIDGGANVDAHADHRLVQALAIIGLGSQHPVTIFNAQHIAKSYPHFFDDLATLGARVERIT